MNSLKQILTMLTRTIEQVLRQHKGAWSNPNELVNEVCRAHLLAHPAGKQPNYGSIIRIAARLKKQARFGAVRRWFFGLNAD